MEMYFFFILLTFVVAILPLAILCVLIAVASRLNDIHKSMKKLSDELQVRHRDNPSTQKVTEVQTTKATEPAAQPVKESPPPQVSPIVTQRVDLPPPTVVTVTVPKPPVAAKPEGNKPANIPEPANTQVKPAKKASVAVQPAKPREPSALERRLAALRNWCVYGKTEGVAPGESAEKLLATTWLLRCGILVILFTSVFLLKLSIEKGILSPTGRVAMSYFAGAALLLFGLNGRMRKNYWSLGQALCGISLGVFYFSSFAMTSMYHLVPPLIGGIVMCLTTLTAGFLADRLNSMSIALVALCGGYATPLLLNTGANNFPGLFAYLLLLGVGVLCLAYRRNWLQLNMLSMAFTYGIYALAYDKHFAPEDFAICQTALVLFFVLFSTIVFLHNVRKRIPANALEIFGLLANSGVFFGLSWMTISRIGNGDKLFFAPLTLGLAVYYLLHALVLGRCGDEASKALLLIFCALSGLYLALTFPVVLSGNWLSAAWSLQALTMLWLGLKLKSNLVKNCGWILYFITLIHLASHEFWLYQDINPAGTAFWSNVISRLCQFLLPVASLAAAAKLTMQETSAQETATSREQQPRCQANMLTGLLLAVAFLVLFIFLRLEIAADLRTSLTDFHFTGINLVWIAACLTSLLLLKRGVPGWWRLFFCTLMGGTIIRMFLDFNNYKLWRWALPDFRWSACFGWLGCTTILTIGFMLCGRLLPAEGRDRWLNRACRIIWPILLFVHTTREWGLIIKYKLPGLAGGGISVLWAIFAFVLVFRGISQSLKSLRYLGLALFTVIVFKVFLFDMSHLEAIYKVIAFFVFGVLLLGAAFVYLKFWRGNTSTKAEKP